MFKIKKKKLKTLQGINIVNQLYFKITDIRSYILSKVQTLNKKVEIINFF